MERKTKRGKEESVWSHLKKRENKFEEVKSYSKVRKMRE